MLLGAQFYTVKDYCKTLDDFSESLKRIADIGYTTVQISGTCAFEPQWLKAELDKNGLKCIITHTPYEKLKDCKKVCDDHRVFGCKNIGLGYFGYKDNPVECYENFKSVYMPIAQGIKENGGYFMYHNHDQEFIKIGGKTILQKMAEDFPADTMGFTLDTYWIQTGGASPADYIEEFAGRIPCIHLKDFGFDRKMLPIGEGNINFEKVIAAAERSGVEYLLVEQDNCNGEDPFDCLKRSYKNLNSMGLK